MKQSLYNINEKQLELINKIMELEGEITPEIEQQLEITKGELQSKSIAYLEVIKSQEARSDMIDAEIKRLQQLKKRSNNLVDRLKSMLLWSVKNFGAYEVGTNKFSTRKSTIVEVEDVNSLPKKYKVITVTERADKTAIKKALQDGQTIQGTSLKTNIHLKIN